MRKIFILMLFSVLSINTLIAQRFVKDFEFPLSDSIAFAKVETVDLDNDGFLDLALFLTSKASRQYVQFISGDTLQKWKIHPNTIVCENYTSYSFTDYDADNDMDILLFGTHSTLLNNQGKFTFSKEKNDLPDFTMCKWIDLNNDGKLDIVGSTKIEGNESVITLQQLSEGNWNPVGDTLSLALSDIALLDSGNDGFTDVFVSGKYKADSLFTGLLLSDGAFHFTPVASGKWSGKIASGDLNSDGFFDIYFSGKDLYGNVINRFIVSKADSSYAVRDSIPQISTDEICVADFNSDGKADLAMLAMDEMGKTCSIVKTSVEKYDSLSVNNIVSQKFADLDRDGDLDAVLIVKDDSIRLVKVKNLSEPNDGPKPVKRVFIAKINDRIFTNWTKAEDDHTLSKSLTYDVLLESTKTVQSAEFDLLTEKRLTVSHGNNLTRNFKLVKMELSLPARFIIQPVDNSFMTTKNKSLCVAPLLDCTERLLNAQTISVCSNEKVVLTSEGIARWFSYKKGYLLDDTEYSFTAIQPDTLMAYSADKIECEALTYYIIRIENKAKQEISEKQVCDQEVLTLRVESNWKSVNWSSAVKGNLGTMDSIKVLVTGADTIIVFLQNKEGCNLFRKTILKVRNPVLTVDADHYVISKGAQVQLSCKGAVKYHWSPSTYLSNPDISNPVATPLESVKYIVTGYDSLGCRATATVNIEVELSGFIPGMFTPNNDARNDELKIYGLVNTASFELEIFNREGKLMYQTKSLEDAMQRGWDGTTNGSKQPAGIYFWKVRGIFLSGEVVKLNGKGEGSFLLVR